MNSKFQSRKVGEKLKSSLISNCLKHNVVSYIRHTLVILVNMVEKDLHFFHDAFRIRSIFFYTNKHVHPNLVIGTSVCMCVNIRLFSILYRENLNIKGLLGITYILEESLRQ